MTFDLKSPFIFSRVCRIAFTCLSRIELSRSRYEIPVLIDLQGYSLFSTKILGKSWKWSLYSEGKYPLCNHPVFHIVLKCNYSFSQPASRDSYVCVVRCRDVLNQTRFSACDHNSQMRVACMGRLQTRCRTVVEIKNCSENVTWDI